MTSSVSMETGVYTHLRQLISTVDDLRDVGLNQYIQLPRICVVGTQSAGKSSLLEAVVGIDFLPRGDGVVTRRPLEMRLVHTTTESDSGTGPYAVFEGDATKHTDFQKVKDLIAKKTDEVAGIRKGIVDDPIKVSIFGREVPDLTLIDLPGITRVPLRDSDQTEDIEKVTKEMVLRYATDPRTVILAVIPANQDISTSDALQIARNVDPKGIRTLGVITKVDLMDSGTDAVSMLKGHDIPLRLGYIGVKLRSQLDIRSGLTIHDSLLEEQVFFQKHAAYRNLPNALWGTKTLTAKLAQVLFRHIRHCLPDIKAEISHRRTTVATRLSQLGAGPPQDDAERIQLIWSLVTDFCEILKNTIRGKFDRRLSSYFDDSEALAGGAEIRQIMNELLEDKLRSDMTENMTDYDIDRAVRQHEGDSLPGFPSPDTFEYLLLPHLSEIQQPVYDCLDRISATLDVMANFIISKIFQRFPALGDKVTVLSEEILQAQKEVTKEILEKIVTAETGYVFTNDEEYLINHAQMGKMLASNPIAPQATPASQAQYPGGTPVDPNAPNAPVGTNTYTIKGLQAMTSTLIQNTQQGVSNVMTTMRNSEQMEEHQRTPLYSREFILEIRSRLNSYYKLVLKNTRETVPKTIGYFLVRSLQDVLQYQLYQTLTKAENLDELLGEPSEVKTERKELKEQKEILEKATAVLQRDLCGGIGSGSHHAGFDEFFDRDIQRTIHPPNPVKPTPIQRPNAIMSQEPSMSTSASNIPTPAPVQQAMSHPVSQPVNVPGPAKLVASSPAPPPAPTPAPKRKGLFG